jgi:hypothetical protein
MTKHNKSDDNHKPQEASNENINKNIEGAKPIDEPVEKAGDKQEDVVLDPFDPERLRLSQDFSSDLGVKKALITVPVRKPGKESWIQVHPDLAYRVETAVIELKDDREVYLVDPDLWPNLAAEVTFGPRALFTCIDRQGVIFLWPIRLPGPDGKLNEWHRSAMEAAQLAMGGWVRIVANMSLGGYDVFQATGDLPEPKWPEQSLKELLRIAFKDRFITMLDHPVLQRLRGEA